MVFLTPCECRQSLSARTSEGSCLVIDTVNQPVLGLPIINLVVMMIIIVINQESPQQLGMTLLINKTEATYRICQ